MQCQMCGNEEAPGVAMCTACGASFTKARRTSGIAVAGLVTSLLSGLLVIVLSLGFLGLLLAGYGAALVYWPQLLGWSVASGFEPPSRRS